MINLLYYTTLYYEVCKYIQELEPKALKYELVLEKIKAHERNCLKYKDNQDSQRGNNSTPSYNNLLLSAYLLNIGLVAEVHAIGVAKLMSEAIALLMASAKVLITSKPFVILKLQLWEWQAHLRSSLSTSNREVHPQGVTVAVVVQASKQGFKKKKTPKKQRKQRAYGVMFKNSVPSEVEATSGGRNDGNVLENSVLSGPVDEGMFNRFSCFVVNSKLAHSTNARSKPERLYTDTDPDHRSEIVTDVTIRVLGKAGTMMLKLRLTLEHNQVVYHCINLRLCSLIYVGMAHPRKRCWIIPIANLSHTVVVTLIAMAI